MATDVERLVVSLEASITKYERTMQRALGVTNNTMQRIEKRQQTAIGRTEAGWSAISRGIASAFAGAAALRGAQRLIDESIKIENALKIAGLEGENLERVYKKLYDSAQKNAVPVDALATLYGRAAAAQKELGASNSDLAAFSETVAQALRVQGGDIEQARGALLQLGQALGSARVYAEEFNSINEGARPILQAAAAGIAEAGGSVARLKQLVVDGKISNKAFFDGIQAGAGVLEDKLANAEFTVAQQFVRLRNVLVDVAGDFNDATDASGRTGQAIGTIATFIEHVGGAIAANKDNIGWFVDKLGEAVTALPGVGQALKAIDNFNLSMDVEIQTAVAQQEAARFASETEDMFRIAIESSLDLLSEWQSSWGETLPPELQASVDELLGMIRDGGDEAKIAQAALVALGGTDTPFTEALGHLNYLIGELQRVRGEANATAVAVAQAARPDVSGQPQSYAGQDGAPPLKTTASVTPISLSDYPVTGSTGGKGGGKKSSADRFDDALAGQQRRIDALNQETEMQRTLNPLLNDYGFALERLRAQIELENAAKEAGLPLDAQRTQQIETLATGYATATAEAARLAEAQDKARQTADELAQAGRNALDSIIDGFLEGKDAGELLNSVMQDLLKNLIKMGINAIGGGLFGGGSGGIFGAIGSMFGFAKGTANTGGRRGEARGVVHGQEAVIPLPAGGKVPVIVQSPQQSAQAAQPQALTVHVVTNDEKMSAYVTDHAGRVVGGAAPALIRTSVNASPAATAEKQLRYGMG